LTPALCVCYNRYVDNCALASNNSVKQNMNQELTVIDNNTEVAQYNAAADTGMENIRLRPTYLVLVQSSTLEKQGAKPGQILDVLTGEVFDELPFVPLKVIKNRAYYPPKAAIAKGVKPLCRSNDGLVPSPFSEVPQCSSCAKCPKSVWVSGQRPPCAEKLKVLGIVKETGLPRIYQVNGKSITALRNALERIKQNIESIWYKDKSKPKLNLFDFYFTLTSEPSGTNFVARFEKMLRVANPGEFGPLFEEYVINAKHHDDDEGEAVESAAVDSKVDAAISNVVDAQIVEP
jgi:hypothetical protein